MKRITVLVLALALSACTTISKVEGEQVVNQRMAVTVADAWNKIAPPGATQPYDIWTQEGLFLDQLRLWAAIEPGRLLVATPPAPPPGQKAPRLPTYLAGMPPDQLVGLFETMYSADGSIVKMNKVEPALFAGERGVRFEFSVTRKGDDVHLNGIGWVSVRKDQLYAATFTAPRLHFFAKLLPKAEAIVRTARIKG